MTVAHKGKLIVIEEDGLRRLALLSDEGVRPLEADLLDDGSVLVYAEGDAPNPA